MTTQLYHKAYELIIAWSGEVSMVIVWVGVPLLPLQVQNSTYTAYIEHEEYKYKDCFLLLQNYGIKIRINALYQMQWCLINWIL